MNDSGNYRPPPDLALGWAAEILTVGGIGAVIALDIFRRSRRRLWCALAVIAAAALAVPWRTTDWSLWFDQPRFERISAPANWDVTAYQATTWTAPTGTAGRTFERSFSHRRGVVCRSGSEVFFVAVNREEHPAVVHTTLRKCDNGGDPEGAVDVAALPRGATAERIDRL